LRLRLGCRRLLRLSLARGLLARGWRCGVAARTRAFGLDGVQGWQAKRQQKGKTAK